MDLDCDVHFGVLERVIPNTKMVLMIKVDGSNSSYKIAFHLVDHIPHGTIRSVTDAQKGLCHITQCKSTESTYS